MQTAIITTGPKMNTLGVEGCKPHENIVEIT